MSTNSPANTAGSGHCPQCGTISAVGVDHCWLCGHALSGDLPQEPKLAAAHDGIVAPERTGGFSLASLMMFMTLACVILGISTFAPGVGIPLGLVLIVVWARTAAIALVRGKRGVNLTRAEKVNLFLSTLSVAAGLLLVTGIAGAAAFIAACFSCAGAYFGFEATIGDDKAMRIGITVFSAVAMLIAFPILWWIGGVIYRRWRHDAHGATMNEMFHTRRRFPWKPALILIAALSIAIFLAQLLFQFSF
jgi:hypothetical protein